MGKISRNILTVCIIGSLLLALSDPAPAAKPEGFVRSMSPGGPNIWALDPGTGIWTGYETIQLALNNVVNGGTIFLEDDDNPTIHTESLSITRNVSFTMEGESEAGIIVEADASGPVNGTNTFTVNAAGQTITFQNITIRNGDYGIRSSAGNVNVLHCTFYQNGWDGAGLPDPETASQQDFVDFWNTSGHVTDGGAIRIENSAASEVAYCTVYENDRGIRYQHGSNGNFHHNSSYGNIQSGIYLTDHGSPGGCTNCQVHDNTVYGNMNNGILVLRGNNNTITTNNVYDNWNTGIHMHGPSDFTVQGNTVTNNSRYSFNGEGNNGNSDGGIAAAGTATISATTHTLAVLDNTVTGNNAGSHTNSTGLWLGPDLPGDGITVTGNTFSGQELDVHVQSQAATTVVNENSFGTDTGIKNEDTSATVNGERNWWGSADGPGPEGPGSGTGVSENVDYSPWYTDAGMTSLEWEEKVHNTTKDTWYYTIQAAVTDADSGDTIAVGAGTFTEQVTLTAGINLTLVGEGRDVVTWVAPAGGKCVEGSMEGYTGAMSYEFSGFTFNCRSEATSTWGVGVMINRASSGPLTLSIHDNRFIEDRASGDDTHWATSILTCHNRFASRDGGGVAPVHIYNNIDETWGGMTMSNTRAFDIYNNTFDGCSDAIYNGHGCPDSNPSLTFGDHHIYGNTFRNASDALHPGSLTPALDWQYYGAGAGTHLPSVIEENLFEDNDTAIRFVMDTDMVYPDHLILRNRFVNNDMAVRLDGTFASVLNVERNWWNDASGPGGAGPGTGDPISANVDYSPWFNCVEMTDPDCLERDETIHNTTKDIWYYTIQGAIDDADPGDTIVTGLGTTYDEQLLIDKSLTLDGSNKVAVLQPTAVPAAGVYDVKITAGNVTIQNFTFDFNGPGDDRPGTGIVVSDLDGPAATNVQILNNDITTGDGSAPGNVTGSGTAIQTGKNADVSGLRVEGNAIHCDADGLGEGVYINPGPGTGITVNNNTIDGYIFSGVSIEAGNVTVTNNTILSDAAQGNYGIRLIDFTGGETFSNVSIGTVGSGNQVQNCQKGIRVGTSSDVGSTLTASITGNTITGNDMGIRARYGASIIAHENAISGNTTYGINNESGIILDATRNWWGDSSGPSGEGPGSGDAISIDVHYSPWYNCEAMTDPDCLEWDQKVHNTTQDTWYYTIQAAIDDAEVADTIVAAAGTYPEYLHITTDGLTIQGAGVDQSIIDLDGLLPYWHYDTSGSYASRGGVLISAYGNSASGRNMPGGDTELIENVTFQGFTVRNAGVNPPIPYDQFIDNGAGRDIIRGIKVGSGKDILIQNCKVENGGDYGITSGRARKTDAGTRPPSENLTVHNCVVINNHDNGIAIADTTGTATITNNTSSNNVHPALPIGESQHEKGIQVAGRSNDLPLGGTISGNTIVGNAYHGINLYKFTNGFTVENNTVTGHNLHEEGCGIFLGSGSPSIDCKNHIVRNNTVTGNIRGIIAYYVCSDSLIENNTVTTDSGSFDPGQAAVKVDNSYNITVRNNRVSCDGLGIELTGSDTYDCTMTDNTVDGAMFAGAYIRSGAHDNRFLRNTITGTVTDTITFYADWGTHDGADNEATLADSTKSWTEDAFIGMKVLNLTDQSEGTITDNDATTITAVLSGGADNDWDNGDEYDITYEDTQGTGVFLRGGSCYAGGHAGAGNVFNYNNIYGNDTSGMVNQASATTVDAEYNYWGHCSGPYHNPDNLDGQGDAVSDDVDYDPWLIYSFVTSDKGSCSILSDLNGDGCVNLEDFAELALHWLEGC